MRRNPRWGHVRLSASTYVDLGEALARLGKTEESAAILEKGVAVWPFARDIRKSLVLRYLTLKRFPKAYEALKDYVALFPEDSFMQGALAQLQVRLYGPPAEGQQ